MLADLILVLISDTFWGVLSSEERTCCMSYFALLLSGNACIRWYCLIFLSVERAIRNAFLSCFQCRRGIKLCSLNSAWKFTRSVLSFFWFWLPGRWVIECRVTRDFGADYLWSQRCVGNNEMKFAGEHVAGSNNWGVSRCRRGLFSD